MAAGLTLSAVGAALLTRAGVDADYAAWILPGLALIGAGIGTALVVANAMGSVADNPTDAGTAGGMNNVSQQIGAALGVALISTIAASATSRYLVHHATTTTVSAHAAVHGYAVGYWWAAGLFLASALSCSAIVRPHTSMTIDAAEIEAVEKAIPAI